MHEDARQADPSLAARAESWPNGAGIDPELGPPDQPSATGTPDLGGAAGATETTSAESAGRAPARPDAGWRALTVIAVGGAAGALARYGLATAFPHPPGSFDWVTLGINVSGCALIGALMFAITEVWPGHPLARPFLAVGVLGGFTTFSTYIVDIQRSLDAGAAASALTYLLVTLAAALAAVWTGITGARALARRVPPHRPPPSGPPASGPAPSGPAPSGPAPSGPAPSGSPESGSPASGTGPAPAPGPAAGR